jgi:hypothetical protein
MEILGTLAAEGARALMGSDIRAPRRQRTVYMRATREMTYLLATTMRLKAASAEVFVNWMISEEERDWSVI